MRVVWTETALEGIQRIYGFIFKVDPRAAAQVAERLREAGNNLEILPYRGRVVPGTRLRELVITYPYILRYRINGDDVIIMRVRHTSRRPTKP